MTPVEHSILSAKRFNCFVEDTLHIHSWMDETKGSCPDFRHRLFRHNAESIVDACKLFGEYITNAQGYPIDVKEVVRQHILEDCGCVPTRKEWLDAIFKGDYSKFNRPQRKHLIWLQNLSKKEIKKFYKNEQ